MYSFDIFDTLLMRKVATPKGIFLLMQYYMKKESYWREKQNELTEHFSDLRVESEKITRAFHPYSDIKLEEIYETLGMMTELMPGDIDALIELEIQCERKCIVGMDRQIKVLRKLIQKKEKVVLLSDMYLSAETIHRILVDVDSVFKNIPLYVSSENGKSKANGMLYADVHEKEEEEYSAWTHCGDNIISDINIPKLFGIRTLKIATITFLPWEKSLAEYFHMESSLMLQLSLGVARFLRLKEMSTAFYIGVSCGSLILFPYVLWIIRHAIKKNITKLYFIARDGYVLKKIADIYIEEHGLGIKTKYLYSSRNAWKGENKEQKNLIRKYLEQEINFENDNVAFVDIHGTGRTIGRAAEILGRRLNVFYYVLLETPNDKNCNFYLYSSETHDGIIETFCRAPHGVTSGYANRDGKIIPKCEHVPEYIWDTCGLKEYICGIEAFTKEMTLLCRKLNIEIHLDEIGKWMLRYCAENPDKILADFIGEIPHGHGNREEENTYAPVLNRKELWNICMVRTAKSYKNYYSGENLQFSYKRMSLDEQHLQKLYETAYRGVVGKILHLPKKKFQEKLSGKIPVKIVLYAAGKYGKEFYHRLKYAQGIQLVGWVDVNYQKYRECGYPVQGIHQIPKMEFDKLVIALDNILISETIRHMLIAAGIQKNKILLKDEFLDKYKI